MLNSVKSNEISEHIIERIPNVIFEVGGTPGDKLPTEKEWMKILA